jgi:hypothetical protein
MKITNKHGIPQTLYALATREFYSKGDADYSATEIISPPRIQRLRKKHHDDIEQDAADMLWAMLGSALHVVAERSIINGHINEERLILSINGVKLSGAIDLQKIEDDGVTISDYKFTSAWALMNDKPEWEQQQNIYAYLVEKVKGKRVKKLEIVALIRDWSRREAMYKSSYPQAAIQVVDVPLWSEEKVEAYIKQRIELHRESKVNADWDEELPECSDDDKWMRETKFAVKKEGRKTAVRVFDTQQEADELLATLPAKDKGFIEIRKGEPVRCTGNFCSVNQWCSQYQAYLAEQALTETQE